MKRPLAPLKPFMGFFEKALLGGEMEPGLEAEWSPPTSIEDVGEDGSEEEDVGEEEEVTSSKAVALGTGVVISSMRLSLCWVLMLLAGRQMSLLLQLVSLLLLLW